MVRIFRDTFACVQKQARLIIKILIVSQKENNVSDPSFSIGNVIDISRYWGFCVAQIWTRPVSAGFNSI